MANGTAEQMRVVTCRDVLPISDPTNWRYNPLNDPNLNIQFAYDQEPESVIVEKRKEDFERLNNFLFGSNPLDHTNHKPMVPDTIANRTLVELIWDAWGTEGTDISVAGERLTDRIGLPFEITPEQAKILEEQASVVKSAMRLAFWHIYRGR